MNTAIVAGSLQAIAQRDGMSLAESFVSADAVIIVDVSGSMAATDSRGGKSRYTVALEELARLQRDMPGRLAIIAFSDGTEFVPGGAPRMIGGGTDLAGALRFAKVADVTGMRFVLISDGFPDDEREALQVAKMYRAKVDTIFAGPIEDEEGKRFLQRLAQVSGGQAVTADRVKDLARQTELLLASGK